MRFLLGCIIALAALGAAAGNAGGSDPLAPLPAPTTVRPMPPSTSPSPTTLPKVDRSLATTTSRDATPRPVARQPMPDAPTTTTPPPDAPTTTTGPRLSAAPVTALGPPVRAPQSIHYP